MKKSFLLLALTFVLALVGCEQEEKLPNPQVSLTAGEATETTLSFTVTPSEAKECAYIRLAVGEEIPTAEVILSKGVSIDATKESTQTVTDLTANTEYVFVAAVKNESVTKVSTALKMKTLEAQVVIEDPTVALTAGDVTETTIAFSVAATNAEKVAYVVYTEGEAPAAEAILENGTEVEAEATVVVENLTAATTYYVIAAAANQGKTAVSEVLEMTTEEPANPGDVDIYTIYGRRWGINNYGFQIVLTDGMNVFLDMYCETSVANILPEADYPVVPYENPEDLNDAIANGEYFVHGAGSITYFGNYEQQYALLEGNVAVEHLEEGYKVSIDIVNENGDAVNVSYEGVINGLFEGENFGNPPVPVNDDVIETTVTSVGAQFYDTNPTNFTLWLTTEDGPYNMFLPLFTPEITDGVLPEGTYTPYYGSMEEVPAGECLINAADGWAHIQLGEDGTYIALDPSSTLTVEHMEGQYRLILNMKSALGTTIKATYEGVIGKHWDWDPDITQPGGGNQGGGENNVFVFGEAAWTSGNFCLYFRDAAENGNDLLYIDLYCPSSVWSVIPEGEYVIDPNAAWDGSELSDYYIHGAWSGCYINGYQPLQSGKMTVAHLAEGYSITIEGTDKGGTAFAYTYEGIVEQNPDSWYVINNPPIPYNDVTINTEVELIQGSHNSQRYYDLYVTTTGGEYKLYLPLVAAEDPGLGLIPEGTYTVGGSEGQNYISADESYMQEGEDEESRISLAKGTVTVSHLSEGYQVDIAVESGLMTEIVASYSGLIFKTENSNSNFQNPGYTYPADIELFFDSIEYTGESNGGDMFLLTNAYGDKMTLSFNAAKVDDNGQIEPGVYTACYWYDGSDDFTFNGNDCAATLVDYPREYPYYMDGGFIKVEKSGNTYSILYDGYTWMDTKKLIRVHYEGPIGEEVGGEEGPLDVQWTRVTGTEIGDNAWELNFEGTANGETVRIEYAGFWQMGDYTIGRLNEGVYNVTDSDFTGNIVYASSVYVTVPGAPASDLVSGTVTVSWVEGGYEFVFDVATISGSTLKATYSGPVVGMQDPNTIGGGDDNQGGDDNGNTGDADFLDVEWTSAVAYDYSFPPIGYYAITFEGTSNGERVYFSAEVYMQNSVQGKFNEGVYDLGEVYEGNKVLYGYIQVPGDNAPRNITSGTMTVSVVEEGYEFIFDYVSDTGTVLKAKYVGKLIVA